MRRILKAVFICGLIILFPQPPVMAKGNCPGKDKVSVIMQRLFRRAVQVESVKESVIKGVCEAVLTLRGQKRIIYLDSKGKYVLNGQIYRVADRTNITRETIQDLNKFTPSQMKILDSLVAFEKGEGKKTVYFVTDPVCPFCKRAESIMEPLMKEGKIHVKFLFFPLRFHRGAKEQSISIICDNKGFKGLKGQYMSKNQCEKGKKKVEDSIKFLMQKGITATPTYIFPDGSYHSGVMQGNALLKRLGS